MNAPARRCNRKSAAQIWADYLNSLNQISTGLNKQFIVWGDYVLHKEPRILGLLNKGIIVMDWNYYTEDHTDLRGVAMKVLANGLRVMGAPGLIYSRWGPRPGVEQLRNIDAFADAYSGISDPRCLGLILTNWFPARYIQRSIWDGLAYAAVAFKEGSGQARSSGFRRFVEKHWGAQWNENWEKAFRTFYAIAPGRIDINLPGKPPAALPIPWSNEREFAAAFKSNASASEAFTELCSLLVLCEPHVRENIEDFEAFQLSARYLEGVFWRNAVLVEALQARSLTKESVSRLMTLIATRDRQLLGDLEKDWDAGRPADSVVKLEQVNLERPTDQL